MSGAPRSSWGVQNLQEKAQDPVVKPRLLQSSFLYRADHVVRGALVNLLPNTPQGTFAFMF